MKQLEKERVSALLADKWADQNSLDELIEFFIEEQKKYLLRMNEQEFLQLLLNEGVITNEQHELYAAEDSALPEAGE
jgi:hypothetical protein